MLHYSARLQELASLAPTRSVPGEAPSALDYAVCTLVLALVYALAFVWTVALAARAFAFVLIDAVAFVLTRTVGLPVRDIDYYYALLIDAIGLPESAIGFTILYALKHIVRYARNHTDDPLPSGRVFTLCALVAAALQIGVLSSVTVCALTSAVVGVCSTAAFVAFGPQPASLHFVLISVCGWFSFMALAGLSTSLFIGLAIAVSALLRALFLALALDLAM